MNSPQCDPSRSRGVGIFRIGKTGREFQRLCCRYLRKQEWCSPSHQSSGTPRKKGQCSGAIEPRKYRWLDAAQLIKHALGISYTFPGRPAVLFYVCWEPPDKELFSGFAEHRAEIDHFAGAIRGGGEPEFTSMSYPELWNLWDTPGSQNGSVTLFV